MDTQKRQTLLSLSSSFKFTVSSKKGPPSAQRSPVRRKTMSLIDKALEANRNYAKTYDAALGKPPAPKVAVVTCMDPPLSDLPGILGLPQPDLDVIRTGGPAVTEDVLGELVFSTRVLGSKEILLLNRTGCGPDGRIHHPQG
jgi:hypothetical protein